MKLLALKLMVKLPTLEVKTKNLMIPEAMTKKLLLLQMKLLLQEVKMKNLMALEPVIKKLLEVEMKNLMVLVQ